jgi:hypothetical protein
MESGLRAENRTHCSSTRSVWLPGTRRNAVLWGYLPAMIHHAALFGSRSRRFTKSVAAVRVVTKPKLI